MTTTGGLDLRQADAAIAESACSYSGAARSQPTASATEGAAGAVRLVEAITPSSGGTTAIPSEPETST